MIRPNYSGIAGIVPDYQDELYRLVNERQAQIDAQWRRPHGKVLPMAPVRKSLWQRVVEGIRG